MTDAIHSAAIPAVAQAQSYPVIRLSPEVASSAERWIAVEAPVAIEVNGLGYAVMMASPAGLVEFGTGFVFTEKLVATLDDLIDVTPHEVAQGWLLRIRVAEHCFAAVRERIRHRIADSGCGLCGLENLEQALRPLPMIETAPIAEPRAIFAALAALPAAQMLNRQTGAVHSAALCSAQGAIELAREDVGRHNAFDKLIGAALLSGRAMDRGFVLLSSRCSYELVEKAAIAGVTMLVTISAPTSLAVERSKACGLTLVSLARADNVLVLNDPHGLFTTTLAAADEMAAAK